MTNVVFVGSVRMMDPVVGYVLFSMKIYIITQIFPSLDQNYALALFPLNINIFSGIKFYFANFTHRITE